MRNIVKSFKSEIGELKVFVDINAESPRKWGSLSKIMCFHRRYNIGDEHNYSSSNYGGWEEFRKQLEKDYDIAIILPLYMYDHSGITISTTPFSCPWDSGQIGWAFVTKEDIREEYNIKRVTQRFAEKAEKILLSEIQVYDDYLRGDVYGYILENSEGEQVDSCWGFYGYSYLKDIVANIPKEYQSLLSA